MKKRLILLLFTMVLVPALLLSWVAYRLVSQEQSMQETHLNKLITKSLIEVDNDIQQYIKENQQQIILRLSRMNNSSKYQNAEETLPLIRQHFIIDADGRRTDPVSDTLLTKQEQDFIARSQIIWQDPQQFHRAAASLNETREKSFTQDEYFINTQKGVRQSKDTNPTNHGWFTWFWGNGLNLAFWLQGNENQIIGAELDVARLQADIISLLPDTRASDPIEERIRLVNSKGEIIYQWGRYEAPLQAEPQQRFNLSAPIASWQLEYFAPKFALGSTANLLNSLLLVFTFILCLSAIAFYIYREHRRDAILTEQRVNFVSQVSHELKTPLTNVCMYAELMQDKLTDEHSQLDHYLNVISEESQRLSRLISNVLNFGRADRGQLNIQTCPGLVSDIIEKSLDTFRPLLQKKTVEIIYENNITTRVFFDPDAVEQILNNLIGNVEKYAANGGYLKIVHQYENAKTVIEISDRGQGIPRAESENIFKPFYRISDQLKDGVTGTGIGLNIARALSRSHGGDLIFVLREEGACFRVTLNTPGVGVAN